MDNLHILSCLSHISELDHWSSLVAKRAWTNSGLNPACQIGGINSDLWWMRVRISTGPIPAVKVGPCAVYWAWLSACIGQVQIARILSHLTWKPNMGQNQFIYLDLRLGTQTSHSQFDSDGHLGGNTVKSWSMITRLHIRYSLCCHQR